MSKFPRGRGPSVPRECIRSSSRQFESVFRTIKTGIPQFPKADPHVIALTTMRSLLRIINLAVLCLSSTAVALYAQSANTGTLIGTATDPSGAVVPGAHVELKDISTGVIRSALSNAAGQYSFPGLPPGSYSVKASGTGFREFTVPRITIESASPIPSTCSLRSAAHSRW